MNRRRLLAAAGVGIASLSGCAATSLGSGDEPLQTVSVDFVDDVPDQFPLSITVETVEESITSSHTATIRVSLTNTSGESISVGDGGRRAFSQPWSDEDPGLLLISPSESVRKVPGCWRPVFGLSRSMELVTHSVEPGESLSATFEVWGRASNDTDCVPTGTFAFSTEYLLNSVGEFDWRFGLRVR